MHQLLLPSRAPPGSPHRAFNKLRRESSQRRVTFRPCYKLLLLKGLCHDEDLYVDANA